MSRELHLRRKLTVRAHGQTLVLVKRPYERVEHVVQKALLWALYLPSYPALRVEVPLPQPSRYKPDLLALDLAGEPSFWGECGEVALDKLRFLLQRFRRTHFVCSKWATRLDPFAALIEAALTDARRAAPVELIGFPGHALEWIADDGTIAIPARGYAMRRWA
ncbi:hypothetical protein [Kallotenue papyrolyticum]|uniref:hypothetical protein n=1 Tax=Kallotenue papyrolyticum TaxID=1325125 RepID=UPI000472FA30|nr:hypothetical protein [Kallotenue papyrolyticum]